MDNNTDSKVTTANITVKTGSLSSEITKTDSLRITDGKNKQSINNGDVLKPLIASNQFSFGADNFTPDNQEPTIASEKNPAPKNINHLKPNSAVSILDREFTAKDVQAILRNLIGNSEKIGLALLNYYARTNLVPASGKSKSRGRKKYTYSDLILLCWLFQMKREGLPVNRFRRGIDYLRKKMPKLHKNPTDMILLTDGKQLFLKNRVEEKSDIAEALTGRKAGQYCWAYAIGSLIEEVDRIVDQHSYTKAAA